MVKGLFLDRVDMDGYRATVNEAAQLSVYVYPCPASSPLATLDDATVSAQKALNGAVFMEGMPVARSRRCTDEFIGVISGVGETAVIAGQESLPERIGQENARTAYYRGKSRQYR
jgi:hypothetical protein